MSGRFVEGALRCLAVTAGIGAIVGGGFVANRIVAILETSVLGITLESFIDIINPNVIQYTQVSAGLAIGLGILSLLMIMSLILRIGGFNPGTCGKIILFLDIVIIFLCLAGFAAGGVIGALGANIWSSDFVNQVNPNLQQFISVIVQTRDALAGTAAVSLFACFIFVLLELWMIVFAARNWETMKYSSFI